MKFSHEELVTLNTALMELNSWTNRITTKISDNEVLSLRENIHICQVKIAKELSKEYEKK